MVIPLAGRDREVAALLKAMWYSDVGVVVGLRRRRGEGDGDGSPIAVFKVYGSRRDA